MKITALIFSFLFTIYSSSQITIGLYGKPKNGVPSIVKDYKEQLSFLKQTETIFYCMESDSIELFQRELDKVWTLTKSIKCKYYSNKSQENKNTSYFTVFPTATGSNQGHNAYKSYRLTLWIPSVTKKGKPDRKVFCQVLLPPTKNLKYSSIKTSGKTNYEKLNSETDYIYSNNELRNWKIGFIKNHLNSVNNSLTNGITKPYYESLVKKDDLKHLKQKKLIIPEYCFIQNMTYNENLRKNIENIIAEYNYKVEVLKTKDLNIAILAKKEDFYYLSLIKSPMKIITIFNNKTGEEVFNKKRGPGSMNLNKSDLRTLNKLISKLN